MLPDLAELRDPPPRLPRGEASGPSPTPPGAVAGVEQTKHLKEEPKEEKAAKPESVVIKRRLSALAQGQAISVLGAQGSAASLLEEEAPQAKRRPEPIMPATQPR